MQARQQYKRVLDEAERLRMKNQKEEFFELIYAQYAKKLERICLRYVNYQPEYRKIAADSVQKTFLKALEEYGKLKDASYIEPWLYQTCMHRFTTALKTYRRRMKHHVVIDEKMENVLSAERTITTIDALLDKESNLELLNRVFDAFTDRERSIAQDYFVSEMTAEEVANRNQTSIGAIKAIVFRMRTKAKKIAKENPNFLLIAPYLLILLGASKK